MKNIVFLRLFPIMTALQLHDDLQRHFVSKNPSFSEMVMQFYVIGGMEKWTRNGARCVLKLPYD